MRSVQITLLLLLGVSTADATVYSWRDTNGVLVMTNDEDEVPVETGGPVITYSTTTSTSDRAAEESRSVAAPTSSLASNQVAATVARGSTEPTQKALPPGGRDLVPDIGHAPPSKADEPQAQAEREVPTEARAALQPDVDGLTPPDVDIRSSSAQEGPRIHGRSLEETRAAQDAPSQPSREIGPAGVTTTVEREEAPRRGTISEERLARADGATGAKQAGTASTSSSDDWLRVDPRELLLSPRKPPRVVVRVVSPSSEPLSTSRSLSSAGSAGGSARTASGSAMGRSRGRTSGLQ